jgi:hypothetical protein
MTMIFCWIYRRLISHRLDANEPLPERVQNHIRNCPGCRTFHASGIQLAEQLIGSAPLHRKAPSPFLHGKILASIDSGTLRTEPEQRAFRPAWSVAFVSLGLVLICAAVIHFRPLPQTSATFSPSPVAEDAAGNSDPMAATVKLPNADKLREWSQNWDQPLQTELQSVVHDAKQALQLLAHNFLPDQYRESLTRE